MMINRKLIVLLTSLTVATIIVIIIAVVLRPHKPSALAVAALDTSSTVEVKDNPHLSFRPVGSTPTTGFIFYVGSNVPPEAYAHLMKGIAAEGYLAIVPKMPANMAIFNWEAADTIIIENPQIEYWAIGGHSLGGVMASRYVKEHPEQVDGLVFWASYPAQNYDLSDRDIKVSSIYGSLDGLASPEEILASKPLLPADTMWVKLTGGNHAQFGGYGEQKGDLPADLLSRDQQAQVVKATVVLLESISR